MGRARGHEDRAARVGGAQQRVERADEAVVGGHVDRHHLVPDRLVDMGDGRELAEDARIADEDVELAPALVDRRAEPVEGIEILEVEGTSVAAAPSAPDLVVELFERALRAGERNDVGAGLRRAPAPRRGRCRATRR